MTAPNKTSLVTVASEASRIEREESQDDGLPKVGQWIRHDGNLCCAIDVGSNHVKVEHVFGHVERLTFDEWDAAEHINDVTPIIEAEIARTQATVKQLLGEVQAVTLRLGVGPRLSLNAAASEADGMSSALATRSEGAVDSYKDALVLAKETTLPKLFAEIGRQNENLTVWMKAPTIPLLAQSEGLNSTIKRIDIPASRRVSISRWTGSRGRGSSTQDRTVRSTDAGTVTPQEKATTGRRAT